ncbi:MAG: DNA translocase FtsK 4TM domain-containing protein [Planctomycetes bacterium]|nr:DNA translocase FtsK 4TM domain-containing protein [Planctomycetota bacterium]
MENERAKETTAIVTGLAFAGLAVFCGLSLYSHAPADVMDFEAATAGRVGNLCGLIGAKVAHHLLCLYGAGAWVSVLCLLAFGAMMCAARSLSGIVLRGFGSLLLVAIVCTWVSVPFVGAVENAGLYPAGRGGILGSYYLAPPLVNYFGPVGVYLVLVTALILSGLMIAKDVTEFLLGMVGRGCVRVAKLGWDAALGKLKEHAAPAPALQPVAAGNSARLKLERAAVKAPVPEAPPVPQKNDFIAIAKEKDTVQPATRKLRQALVTAEDLQDLEDDKPEVPEAKKRALPKVEAKKPEPVSDEDEAKARREEAVRQADMAEKERIEREKDAKERSEKEAKALEKLEKERAGQEREKEKARQKFMAAMQEKQDKEKGKPGGTKAEEGAAGEPAAAKPKLPDDYTLPDYSSLEAKDIAVEVSSDTLKDRGAKLIETLWEFKIGSRLVGIHHGPAVTMYELSLDPGIKVQRVMNLSDNLSMAMKAENGVRIIAPIPGRDTIGIEIPNLEDYVVRMRPIMESTQFRSGNWTLPLILGRDATGNPLVADLARMPHLLIAGTTGSGKSVCVNSIILSLMILRRPHEVKLILVDPKQVEMTDFKGIPHLLSPVVSDMKLAAGVLTWAVQKMEDRYERMSKVGVRNIATFNKLTQEERLARLPQDESPDNYVDPMPYIVIIVDEFADLMMTSGKEIEQAIARLAQKARAAGIHVILATQRPSADVVTGLIKTNLPCRICFQVKSKIDSRIVLDTGGADKLAGKGDMLFVPPGTSQLIRAKGVFIADHETKAVVDYCKKQAAPIYSDEIERVAAAAAHSGEGEQAPQDQMPLDEKFEEGVECFLAVGRASTSLLQRRMGLGYTRAAKLCDQMEQRGIVGPDRGAKGRELLITPEAWESYKKGMLADKNHAATWGDRKSAAGAAGSEPAPLPALAAVLDPVDGTRGDEHGDRSDVAEDGEAKVDTGLVGQLDHEPTAAD